MLPVEEPSLDSSDSDSVNTTQFAASIPVPPPVNNDDDLSFNTVRRDQQDPLTLRRTLLESRVANHTYEKILQKKPSGFGIAFGYYITQVVLNQ